MSYPRQYSVSCSYFLRSDVQARLGMQNGTLFAAPMPEQFAAQGAEVKAAVDQAIRESEENGMNKKGKEVTPWLLARVFELTGGKSLENSMSPNISDIFAALLNRFVQMLRLLRTQLSLVLHFFLNLL